MCISVIVRSPSPLLLHPSLPFSLSLSLSLCLQLMAQYFPWFQLDGFEGTLTKALPSTGPNCSCTTTAMPQVYRYKETCLRTHWMDVSRSGTTQQMVDGVCCVQWRETQSQWLVPRLGLKATIGFMMSCCWSCRRLGGSCPVQWTSGCMSTVPCGRQRCMRSVHAAISRGVRLVGW